MLSEADIHEFQALFTAKFGVKLDYDTAYQKLSLLVLQMKTLYVPITQSQLTNYEHENAKRAKSTPQS